LKNSSKMKNRTIKTRFHLTSYLLKRSNPMKRLLALALLASLPGCATLTGPVPASPAAIADRTVLDEKFVTSAAVSYTAASKMGTTLVRVGLIDRENFKELDRRAYAALGAIRTAYDTGNATGFDAAVRNFYSLVGQITSLTPE
jgi:hypothetical protein